MADIEISFLVRRARPAPADRALRRVRTYVRWQTLLHAGKRKPRHGALRIGLGVFVALAMAACGDVARLPVVAWSGAMPTLPEPRSTLIRTVHIAPAMGWPAGVVPSSPPGTQVNAFARDLDHPRWLLVLPNGEVLVAETNAPPRPDDAPGIRGWIMGWAKARRRRKAQRQPHHAAARHPGPRRSGN